MTWLAAAVEDVGKSTSLEDGDGVATAFCALIVDWTSSRVGVLALSSGEIVDESDIALVEGCRSFEGFPPMLNSLDKVSAGCKTAASWFSLIELPLETSANVVTGVAPLPASESSDTAFVDTVDGRVAEVDGNWLGVLVRRSAARSVAAGMVEEVAAKVEVS